MWYLKIVLFFQVFYPVFVIGLDCTNQCCYFYDGVPKNVTTVSCTPEGIRITWTCQAYSPPNTTLSVKWYRSATEDKARKEGELISEIDGRYQFDATHALSPFMNNQSIVDGLFLNVFELIVENFSTSKDDGYYWCQLVVNDSCLEPSDFGYITFNRSFTDTCSLSALETVEYKSPQVCALESQCNITTTKTEHVMTTVDGKQTQSTYNTTAAVSNSTSPQTIGMVFVLYAVIGVLIVIVLLLLLVVVAFIVYTARNHKVYDMDPRHNRESASEMREISRQSMNIYDVEVSSTMNTLERDPGPPSYYNTPQAPVPLPRSDHPQEPQEPPPNDRRPSQLTPSPPINVPGLSPPPTEHPPTPMEDNQASLTNSQEGSYAYPRHQVQVVFKSGNHERTSDTVSQDRDSTYVYPNHQPLHAPKEDNHYSLPKSTADGQYQGIRVSRLDYTEIYTIANAKKTVSETKDNPVPKAKPSYVNLQN